MTAAPATPSLPSRPDSRRRRGQQRRGALHLGSLGARRHAYTGTWGAVPGTATMGDVVKIWALDAAGAPVAGGFGSDPGHHHRQRRGGERRWRLLVASAERGAGAGLYVYALADPRTPALAGHARWSTHGLHTATFAEIGGRRYVFAARNPPRRRSDDLRRHRSRPRSPSPPACRVPADYGIHDTYVRDGLAFVFAWNSGVIIYDVGNGIKGGAPLSRWR